MNFDYTISFICGCLIGVLLVVLVRYLRKKRHPEWKKYDYDERQLTEQGKASRAAMYTAVISVFVLGIAQDAGLPISGTFIASCCIALTLVVFAGICIFKDAYFYTSKQPKFYNWYFGIIGILLVIMGCMNFKVVDGVISSKALNLPLGIMCLAITVMILIKRGMDKKTIEE